MIRPIQYLRGIAAMMVVWHHSLGQVDGTMNFIRLPPFGQYGVDLFFMISGFIMLVTTWDKPVTPLEFIGNRVRRIVPLYWLTTLLMLGVAIIAPGLFKTLKFDVASILKSLFFIPYDSLSFPGSIWPLLVPGWTLNYEMFFYALFAGTLLVERNWRVPIMVAVLSALVVAGYALHPSGAALQVYTNHMLLEFGAGMILGRIWVMRKHARRGGGHAVLMALGDASYSIYLTHIFTLGALRIIWVRVVPDASMASSIALMAVSLAVSALVGYGVFRWVEKPLTDRLRGLVVRRDAARVLKRFFNWLSGPMHTHCIVCEAKFSKPQKSFRCHECDAW
jgi:exopolysaccharide production protein ExoZ